MTNIHTGKNIFYIGNDSNHPLAYISYTSIGNDTWQINHTVVNPQLRNQGIAKKLTIHLLDIAQEQQIKIIPICSYAKSFFNRYPEYQSLLQDNL